MSLDAELLAGTGPGQAGKLVKQEADVCAWIIDEKGLGELLTFAMENTSSNVLQRCRERSGVRMCPWLLSTLASSTAAAGRENRGNSNKNIAYQD